MRQYAKVIGFGGTFLVVAGLTTYAITSVLSLVPSALLGVGLLALFVYLYLEFDTIRSLLSSRSTRFGANAVVSAVIVFAILVLINFIARQHNLRVDTTEAQQFSLSPQTQKVLNALETDLRFSAFFKSGTETTARDLLTEYANASPKVDFEFVDPDQRPAVARNYGIKQYGTIVVEYGPNTARVEQATEEALTNAIIKVTREARKKIYFLTGHGEKSIETSGKGGFSAAREAIEEENYDVESLLLADKEEVPEDCAVLVIAGPQKPLLENEIVMLESYLRGGGNALIMIDPMQSPGLAGFLQGWGVEAGDNVVVDATNLGQLFGAGPELPIVVNYGEHPITEGFGSQMTIFPLARSVLPGGETDQNLEVTILAETQSRSWAETKFDSLVQFDEGEDIAGPISVAAVVTREGDPGDGMTNADTLASTKIRLVIFGDSDFASDEYLNFVANADLFLNAVNWLAEEKDLISIRPKSPADRRLFLTETQSRTMLIFAVILLPLAVLGAAVMVYNKRK